VYAPDCKPGGMILRACLGTAGSACVTGAAARGDRGCRSHRSQPDRSAAVKASSSLGHPAVPLLACLLVPACIDLACAVNLEQLNPSSQTLVLRASGVLLAVSWGWAGLLACILFGVLLGLPVAGLQVAYLRAGLARIERGHDVRESLRPESRLLGLWPWLPMVAVAWLVGWVGVFGVLGGTLMAVNVLWARTLVYRAHLLAYEYLRADEELRWQEMRETEPERPRLEWLGSQ